jgi:conserved oligomeric Golgi complex subunit 2
LLLFSFFKKPNFDLDTFLTRYKRDYGLERLQTDLAIYLKILKTSMIDLINKDYADFVNLSTNLVGLEKAINDFEQPLSSFKKDIEVFTRFLVIFIYPIL